MKRPVTTGAEQEQVVFAIVLVIPVDVMNVNTDFEFVVPAPPANEFLI